MIWYTVKQIRLMNRVLVAFSCIVFGFLMYFNTVNIQEVANNALSPYLLESYSISQSKVQEIDNQFGQIIDTTPSVSTILLYKFVANKNTAIYDGRIGVTSKSRDEGNLITRFKDLWLPMQSDTDRMQTLLLNNTHYETYEQIRLICERKRTETISKECDTYFNTRDDYKAVFTLPLFNKEDYSVKGYITFLLSKELTENEQQVFIKSVAPYIQKVSSLVSPK